MSEADDDDPLIGAMIAERYRIERRLGQGGMGAVYLAEHVRMRKAVAIKVLHKEMGRLAEAVFRFEREAVAAGRVDHQHLVTATDFGELPDGSMYLVLEYVPGSNLATLMAQGPIPTLRSLRIARQIAAALGAIHRVGIVHRDVKPDNVMLVERAPGEDFVKLLDFGMAKVHQDATRGEPQITRQGLVFGTPRYMAPEQAAGQPTDHRADLYGLGILLYAMLSGNPPFSAEEIRDVLRMQRFEPPPPLPAHVEPAVAGLVMTLLAKDPKERVQSADGVIEYIDRLIAQLEAPKDPGRRAQWAAFAKTRAGLALILFAAFGAFVAAFALAQILTSEDEGAPAAASTASAGDVRAAAAPSAPAPPAVSVAASSSRPVEAQGADALLVRAEVGDAQAWRALEARSSKIRSAREWYVLGVARQANGKAGPALEAYLSAAELDPKYGEHPRVLHDVMNATRTDDWETALRVAAALPGSAGADILFDTWASTPKATSATQRAKELLLVDSTRAKESEAVRVAFDLRNAQGQSCDVRHPIVERAVQFADTRSLRPLLILSARTGCGRRHREDCFTCLRGDGLLEKALDHAKNTPAPDYSRLVAAN